MKPIGINLDAAAQNQRKQAAASQQQQDLQRLEQHIQTFAKQNRIQLYCSPLTPRRKPSNPNNGPNKPVIREISLPDSKPYSLPSTAQHVQSWINVITEQAGSRKVHARTVELGMPGWKVQLLGSTGTHEDLTMFGWVAEREQPKSLVLSNYGFMMSFDSSTLRPSADQGNQGNAGKVSSS